MEESSSKLTDSQRATIERNRQHALLLRQARLASHPYLNKDDCVTRIEGSKLVDTGGGFYIEASALSDSKSNGAGSSVVVVHPEVPAIFPSEDDAQLCTECGKEFIQSFLMSSFDVSVCNDCRDDEEKHALMTKSEAKSTYLLTDVDLDIREPKLRFILRKNPHNSRWGDMKLFLHSQVLDRAVEVWGSKEMIEEEKEKRAEKREKSRRKKFQKSVKELRMAVRSSTYTKDLSGHQHQYGEEVFDEEQDIYSKTCTTCGHTINYEQM